MALSEEDRHWYINQINQIDPTNKVITIDEKEGIISYTSAIRSDESLQRNATPEEWVHALAICLLVSQKFEYPLSNLYHEKYYAHGRKGTLSDEVDLIIFDSDDLPYAVWEFKSSDEYETDEEGDIKHQLFGTAPLIGAPKLLVHATIHPRSDEAAITLKCIDYTKYPSYESWVDAGRPCSHLFPYGYQDIGYEPFTNGGNTDLRMDCTQADFRAAAAIFHNEFFGEHPDNVLFTNLVKCLLAKIYDERHTRRGDKYKFQVLYRNGKEETSLDVARRINEDLYQPAYLRYIDPSAENADEINGREFPPERVKTVVKVLQSMSITKGAALHGDIIGAFFEEILRVGFKQDKGMYFTHDNLVQFIVEAVDIAGLTKNIWKVATHPDNRLPYIIDPACGSGTFLLKAMGIATQTVQNHKNELVADFEAEQFYKARMSASMPNYWAENFIYGLDPKFVMAITAKVNMVLHGDGSAHIFKQDAFRPLSTFSDSKFRPLGDPLRSIPKARYKPDVSESFDLVVSNPPFGITLASDTRRTLSKSFSLKTSLPSEALFLERCFQLLKPNGRLAVVIPESLLNAADLSDVRLFLYRMFWIRAIVALPRNMFIDTPTLTSLLFAQKKTSHEIDRWDSAWAKEQAIVDKKVKTAKSYLSKVKKTRQLKPAEVQEHVLSTLYPVVDQNTWILKRGKNAGVMSFTLPHEVQNGYEAMNYYGGLLKLASFSSIVEVYVFGKVASEFDYKYPVFSVEEVGYKLSKRKEKIRPNQLCKFVGATTSDEKPNLHLTDEEFKVVVDTENPKRVLDYIRKSVTWR
ncbi:MAG: restriction endonuclease subunit M [Caldilineaceae bacterium]|nr:restriction endonuclease subunit M [Caldilineaceae bacterium]